MGDVIKEEDNNADEQQKKPHAAVWRHDVNVRAKFLDSLPADFKPTGTIRGDYQQVAKTIGAVPHPCFKISKVVSLVKSENVNSILGIETAPVNGSSLVVKAVNDGGIVDRWNRTRATRTVRAGDRIVDINGVSGNADDLLAESQKTGELNMTMDPLDPVFTIMGHPIDRISCHVLSLILPQARTLKVINFMECRLDLEGVKLLRAGLVEPCSVECLQVSWNPFSIVSSSLMSGRQPASSRISARMGSGRKTSKSDGSEPADETDPVGKALAAFCEPDCVLECVTIRACGVGIGQMKPLSDALRNRPWQLRQINLWDNSICDMSMEVLAMALTEYRGLEFLGLGRNLITDRGVETLLQPLNSMILDEAGKKDAEGVIKEQTAKYDADQKAKAKAKKPADGARITRGEICHIDELEERVNSTEEEVAPSWILRRISELKVLSLSENPKIVKAEVIEKLQALGPRKAEMILSATPAAAAIIAKFPDLSSKEKKSFCFPTLGQNPDARTDGWTLRLVA